VVGVLGGSFNPAHDGHVYISIAALHQLRLDEVWWLVSPQNPLKSQEGMASQRERIAGAEALVNHPKIKITGLEAEWGTRFTADSLATLKQRFPRLKVIWIMGADNLAQISKWNRWTRIFESVTVAVFDRSPYSRQAMASKAAHRYSQRRVNCPGFVAKAVPPAWIFLHLWRHPASATAIRRRLAGQP
jgi:nicotinate-nucleotide adenylyltransferase